MVVKLKEYDDDHDFLMKTLGDCRVEEKDAPVEEQ